MTDINNILDRINKEIDANSKILVAEIPNGLSVKDRVNRISLSPEASKAQARNECLFTKKLELEALETV